MTSRQWSWDLHPECVVWESTLSTGQSLYCVTSWSLWSQKLWSHTRFFSLTKLYRFCKLTVSQICFLLLISIVTTVWAMFCLHYSLQISMAGQLWNFALFVLPTAFLSSSFKTGGRLCNSLYFSPDDSTGSLSLLTSKPNEEILPDSWDWRSRGHIQGWEKDPLSPPPTPGPVKEKEICQHQPGVPCTALFPRAVSRALKSVGCALGDQTRGTVSSLYSVLRQIHKRSEASPSPTRCHGNLWVLEHTPWGKERHLKMTEMKFPCRLAEWGLESELVTGNKKKKKKRKTSCILEVVQGDSDSRDACIRRQEP